MKHILILSLMIAMATIARSETNETVLKKETSAKPILMETGIKKNVTKDTAAPVQAAKDDSSANYVGTNDFYLALVREGIHAA